MARTIPYTSSARISWPGTEKQGPRQIWAHEVQQFYPASRQVVTALLLPNTVCVGEWSRALTGSNLTGSNKLSAGKRMRYQEWNTVHTIRVTPHHAKRSN